MGIPHEGLTPEQEAAIVRAYGEPWKTVGMIADEAGVSQVTVFKVIKRTGTPLRGPKQTPRKPSPAQERRARKIIEALILQEQGLDAIDIAAALDVTLQTAYIYLRAGRETVDDLATQA